MKKLKIRRKIFFRKAMLFNSLWQNMVTKRMALLFKCYDKG